MSNSDRKKAIAIDVAAAFLFGSAFGAGWSQYMVERALACDGPERQALCRTATKPVAEWAIVFAAVGLVLIVVASVFHRRGRESKKPTTGESNSPSWFELFNKKMDNEWDQFAMDMDAHADNFRYGRVTPAEYRAAVKRQCDVLGNVSNEVMIEAIQESDDWPWPEDNV